MTSKFSKLAIFGGNKLIDNELKKYTSIGVEELNAAKKVLESGVLSKFLAESGEDFYGGPKVREFEKACCDYFNVKHAITVNSWTSGLVAAVGSLDIEPGDEIIVSPWTMCASATAILHWNAIPVFADIEDETFCLDPSSVEKNISNKTKAIMSVDIFGHSANILELNKIAKKYNLKIISDTAQAPSAKYHDKYAGTLTDIGGYSLNYHKHIHTGEGGVLVTNDDNLCQRMQLIRNHAEAIVDAKKITKLNNMIGHNFRLGEIECAIGVEQLKKLDKLVNTRILAAEKLTKGIQNLTGISTPVTKENCTHVYYMYPIKLDLSLIKVPRDKIVDALEAEGLSGLSKGYTNIHMLPMYQKKIAYGSNNFPWSLSDRKIDYGPGTCKTAEILHNKLLIGFEMCLYELNDYEIDLIINVFKKVWSNLDQLKVSV